MSKWGELTKKPPQELSDAERVAIGSVIRMSFSEFSTFTMDDIYDRMLGEYNYIFSHCDPLPRGAEPRAQEEGRDA